MKKFYAILCLAIVSLTQLQAQAPLSLLLKNDWIYKEKLCFGLNLNYRSSVGFSFSYDLMKKYKFLYGFDYSTTDISNGLPNSSQYFMLSLQL